MKNLILLLTSLLLAGAASATVLDFERVETHQDTSIDLNQDFQVAHPCGVQLIHMGGRHLGDSHIFGYGLEDGRGHVDSPAKCEHRWKINKCAKENRVINLWAGSNNPKAHVDNVCGETCPFGQKPGPGDQSQECIPDNCDLIPDHVWQPQHQTCVSIAELIAYCETHNQFYNRDTRECESCPAGSFPQGWGGCSSLAELNNHCAGNNPAFVYGVSQKSCVSIFDMREYCRTAFGKTYNASTANCESCPAGSYPQNSGCVTLAELNEYCGSVKSGDVYGVAQDACVREVDMRRYCKDRLGKTYNPNTANCQPCPTNHFPQDSGCVSLSDLVQYCKNNGNQAFDSVSNTCQPCSDSEVLRIHKDGSSSCGDNSIERCDAMNLAFSIRTEECVTCRDIMVPYEGLCQASKQACNYRDRFFFAETGCVDRCPANTIERDGECVCRLKSGGSCASLDYLRKRCTNSGKVFNTSTGECSNS